VVTEVDLSTWLALHAHDLFEWGLCAVLSVAALWALWTAQLRPQRRDTDAEALTRIDRSDYHAPEVPVPYEDCGIEDVHQHLHDERRQ
jgi:hypothetical protein